MDDCILVRELHFKEGLSVRAVARRTGLHRKTIRKILGEGGPPIYRRGFPAARPKLGPFVGVIDEILKSDRHAPGKQRHTAKRIFDRLRTEHGYTGGYTQVKSYVRECLHLSREAFVPLEFGPAQAQVDWGEAWVQEAGQPLKVHLFILTLPFSDVRFVACFPRESLEFFLEGHLRAFDFLGGVPRRIVYDNLKAAVTRVGPGRRRERNTTFEAFCRRHLFEAAFCNVARGNEKGHVENGVGWARRNLFVPMPDFLDWESFNAHLAEQCRGSWTMRLRGHEATVGERLEEERPHFLPLAPWHLPTTKPWTVSSLCLVRFDSNDYSVPCRWAHHPVTVRADVDKVRIFFQDQCIATHTRCHGRERAIYEPWHYLALVEHKPRSLDWGAPMKDLFLPDCFQTLRHRMEDGQEHSRGTRAYIRVLRFLERYPLSALTRAVERALSLGVEGEEAIRNLLLCPPEQMPSPLDLTGRQHLAAYRIAAPDPSLYSALAQGGMA
jgi:transposase